MKTIHSLSILCLVITMSFIHCKKDPFPISACIQQKVDSIKISAKRTPPAEVHVWSYGGRNVYLLNAPCCNEFVKVVDENCQYICSPSGGPVQYGDSLCPNFYQDARYVGIVYRDDR